MPDNSFENSQEREDWLDSGGRDEELSEYYNDWSKRVNND